MAQHDYVIANGTGAAVRSDLNNALAAIVSLNSGATEPTTTYAYQLWADTSAGVLKLRDGANAAWITLRELDGTLTIEDGTVSAPALAFADDLNTGIYSPGDNALAVTTDGVERVEWGTSEVVFNDGGANYDFRVEGDTNSNLIFADASADYVGIGTSTPSALLDLGTATPIVRFSDTDITGYHEIRSSNTNFIINSDPSNADANSAISFNVDGSERARIDSSGRLLVGTTSSSQVGSLFDAALQVESTSSAGSRLSLLRRSSGTGGPLIALGKTGGSGNEVVLNDDSLGSIDFSGGDGTDIASTAARIQCFVDGTPGSNDMPGRIVLATTADGSSSPTERMRIHEDGSIGFNTTGKVIDSSATSRFVYNNSSGFTAVQNTAATVLYVGRNTNDGNLVEFRQANVTEGSISVSGTTVSYNGAHLSRWSQITGVDPHDKADRPEILRGTVMSNLDEMCDWIDPESGESQDNEQLNKTKISDVEGDKNVAGIFQSWDDDDDTWVNDYYLAMTGDFVIRIATGVTVERGDLLMSAGDGTAKPQDDDIIRSKTIAKVTSTTVSCTYEDGSYCVPCVLMAC